MAEKQVAEYLRSWEEKQLQLTYESPFEYYFTFTKIKDMAH